MNKLFYLTLTSLVAFNAFCLIDFVGAQEKRQALTDSFQVRWIDEISTSSISSSKSGFFNQLFKFIVGKKELNLVKPINVLQTEPSSIWILDQGRCNLIHLDTTKNKLEFIGAENNESFPSLIGICNWVNNSILFTDSQLNKIFHFPGKEKKPTVLSDTLKLQHPTGIAYSKINKEIWVSETQAHRLLVLNNEGEIVKKIGRRGTARGEFNFPTFLWIDESGLIYVVDSMNFRIQVLKSDGEVLTTFGQPGDATGFFARPKGIATDNYGHIYIVDALFHAIQVFNIKGELLYYFGKQGRGKGEFWLPVGICIENNKIYVADSYNSRIQVFELF